MIVISLFSEYVCLNSWGKFGIISLGLQSKLRAETDFSNCIFYDVLTIQKIMLAEDKQCHLKNPYMHNKECTVVIVMVQASLSLTNPKCRS